MAQKSNETKKLAKKKNYLESFFADAAEKNFDEKMFSSSEKISGNFPNTGFIFVFWGHRRKIQRIATNVAFWDFFLLSYKFLF